MTSKPNKNMDSIGRGLLNDKQKYRNGEAEGVEMKEMSKKYNYVNFDDQEDHVVRQPKPSEQQTAEFQPNQAARQDNPQYQYNKQPQPQTRPYEQPPVSQPQPNNVADYPSFEYQQVPNPLPVYPSGMAGMNGQQQQRQQFGSQACQPQYQSNYRPQPYAPQYCGDYAYGYNGFMSAYPGLARSYFGYEKPMYFNANSHLVIPAISHGQLQPAFQSNIRSSQVPQASQAPQPPQMDNRSRVNLNGMSFASKGPEQQQQLNKSTLDRKPEERVKVPDMLVSCNRCNCPQNIPGDSTVYRCYNCQQKGRCYPTHNIFKCSNCNKRVCYQLGTSHLIRCGYCKTVNEVPVSHEESLNISINASRIEPPKEEEKQAEPVAPRKKKEVEAQPLLQPDLQYPAINSEEEGFGDISEIIREDNVPAGPRMNP